MRDRLVYFLRHAVRIAARGALAGESFERLLRARIAFAQFLRILIGKFVERKGKSFEKARGLRDRLGRFGEKPRHLWPALQMPLGVGLQAPAERVDRRAGAGRGQHVFQGAPRSNVHEHVVGGEQRQMNAAGEIGARGERVAHSRSVGHRGGKPDAAGRRFGEPKKKRLLVPRSVRNMRLEGCGNSASIVRLDKIGIDFAGLGNGILGFPGAHWQNRQTQPIGRIEKILPRNSAKSFLRFQIAAGEQAREPRIGGTVLRVGENVRRAVAENETHADGDAQNFGDDLILAREQMGAHHAGERIAVGDADALEPEFIGALDIFLRMRGATQKGEIRRHREFGEGDFLTIHERLGSLHAKSPCRNQRGRGVPLS